jgi:hypothetical protein
MDSREKQDRILSAWIAGTASRHASTRGGLTGTARAAAVAELAELAAGRSDLLAEFAGMAVGLHEGDLHEDRHLLAAQLCIEAGADTSQIPHWIDEGRRRAREIAAMRTASPRAAVLEAFARVEGRLGELLEGSPDTPARYQGARHMARLAHEQDLISDETLAAVEGLAVLRNLAAHSPRDEIGIDRARDYLALADAVLFALRSKPAA